MASIGDFINTLAQKAGVASDNEELKNVLSAPDLQKIVIPDVLEDEPLKPEPIKPKPESKQKYD